MNVGMKKKVISTLMSVLVFISMFIMNSPINTQAQDTQYVTVYVGDNVSRLTGENAPEPGFEKPKGDIIPLTKVEYIPGDTAFTVLLKAAEKAGVDVDSTQQNVNGIGGLSTYDGGKMSGWMVDVNGPFINVSASSFPVQANDYVEWQYTCSWGSDLGADWTAPLSNRISNIKMLGGSLSPKFDSNNLNYSLLVNDKAEYVQLHPVLENGLGKDGSLKKVDITSQGVSYKSYQPIPVQKDANIVITVGEADDNLKYTINFQNIKDVNSEINGLETWLRDYVESVFAETESGEIVSSVEYNWPTIGFARLGNYDGLDKYLAENAKYLENEDNWNRLKKGVKVTEFERMSLAIGAAQKDPSDFAGRDLIAEIYNFPAVSTNGYPEFAQGSNAAIFALITLDSKQYEIPANAVWSRDKIITAVLNNQMDDGGFTLAKASKGAYSDPDVTAMALQALVPYNNDKTRPEVKAAIDKAIAYLSASQQADGGYPSKSSESTSQAIIALCSLGINIDTDPRFIKTTNSLLSHLLTFRSEDGGFKHVLGSTSNPMASEQALMAFASYVRFNTNQQTLYDYRPESAQDVAAGISSVTVPAAEDTSLTMPVVPEGFKIAIKSTSNKDVIATDGTITPLDKDTIVTLVFKVTKTSDGSTADTKSLSVTVPKGTEVGVVAAGIKSIAAPAVGATSLTMPVVPEGFSVAIKSSSKEKVIKTDGTIFSPKSATRVDLIFTVTKTSNGLTADTKKLSVTVPKKVTVNEIAKAIKLAAPAAGATSLTMPTVPDGFTIGIKTSSNKNVIATDGTITPPEKATKVTLVFTVTMTSNETTADTKSISVTVPKKVLASEIAAAIRSLKAPAAGATSLTMPTVPDGFTIGIKTSSNQDVVATDGTITPPEKATKVTLVFTVTKTSDGTTADTKSISVTVPKKKTTVGTPSASIMSVSSSQSVSTPLRIMANSFSNRERIVGADRYDTAVQIAKYHFPAGADTVILARGDVSADALPAVPLAKKYSAPLLFTSYDALPTSVSLEIKQLKASKVIIIGGEGAVSKNIADALTQTGIKVERVCGTDHYGTAYEIAKILGNNAQAVIVSGNYQKSYSDALSISSWAAYTGVPILYADASNVLPPATQKAITELGINKTILIGGTAVLPESLMNILPNAQRYAGQDLYETNVQVLSGLQPNPVAVYAATDQDFSDGLAISAVAGQSNAWVMLTPSTGFTKEQKGLLSSVKAGVLSFQVLGGTLTMPEKILEQFHQVLAINVPGTNTDTDTSINNDEDSYNDEVPHEERSTSPDTNKKVVLISVNCQTAVDNGLHEKDKFKKAVPKDGVILSKTSVTIKEGQTVFDILKSILAKKKIQMRSEGSKKTAYVQEINNLGEFDGGPTSGWMYCVNGYYPMVSSGEYELADGDVIEWNYTCDLGVDLGQDNSMWE